MGCRAFDFHYDLEHNRLLTSAGPVIFVNAKVERNAAYFRERADDIEKNEHDLFLAVKGRGLLRRVLTSEHIDAQKVAGNAGFGQVRCGPRNAKMRMAHGIQLANLD